MPVIEKAIIHRSRYEPCLSAAIVPADTPITIARAIASAPSIRDSGNVRPMSSLTVKSRRRYDGPRSPCSSPEPGSAGIASAAVRRGGKRAGCSPRRRPAALARRQTAPPAPHAPSGRSGQSPTARSVLPPTLGATCIAAICFPLVARLFSRAETQVLTVMIIKHIVSPAADSRADEMLADVEVQRNDRVIRQHDAFGFL